MNILNVVILRARLHNLLLWKSYIKKIASPSSDLNVVVERLIKIHKTMINIIVNPMSITSILKLESLSNDLPLLEHQLRF